MSLADAREKMETWRRYYDDDRPHSAIGYNVPSSLSPPAHPARQCEIAQIFQCRAAQGWGQVHQTGRFWISPALIAGEGHTHTILAVFVAKATTSLLG